MSETPSAERQVWGLVDALSTPDWAWERAGQNKMLWSVMLGVGLVLCWVGLGAGLVLYARGPDNAHDQQGGEPAEADAAVMSEQVPIFGCYAWGNLPNLDHLRSPDILMSFRGTG